MLIAAFCGCAGQTGANDDSLKYVLDKGELIPGLDTEFPPMGFIDENGNIVGFDIDVAKEVCKRLGVNLTLRGIDWEEIENGKGTQFDPVFADIMLRMIAEDKNFDLRAKDSDDNK